MATQKYISAKSIGRKISQNNLVWKTSKDKALIFGTSELSVFFVLFYDQKSTMILTKFVM